MGMIRELHIHLQKCSRVSNMNTIYIGGSDASERGCSLDRELAPDKRGGPRAEMLKKIPIQRDIKEGSRRGRDVPSTSES